MKTSATQGARPAAPADAETQRHGAKPRGTRPERAPIKKRGAAPPPHRNKEQSPQLKCRCSNGAGRSRRRSTSSSRRPRPSRSAAAPTRRATSATTSSSARGGVYEHFLSAPRVRAVRARRAARAGAAPAEAAAAAPRVGGGRGLSARATRSRGNAIPRRAPSTRPRERAAAPRRGLTVPRRRQRLPEDFGTGGAGVHPRSTSGRRGNKRGRLGGKCAGSSRRTSSPWKWPPTGARGANCGRARSR